MKKVLVLRHSVSQDLGTLGPILRAGGFDLAYFDVGMDCFADVSPLDADLVIVLGDPARDCQADRRPLLRTELAWLRARMIEDLPTLGSLAGQISLARPAMPLADPDELLAAGSPGKSGSQCAGQAGQPEREACAAAICMRQ